MTSPPKSPSLSALSKLALCGRQRPLRIMVVGQTGVGKSGEGMCNELSDQIVSWQEEQRNDQYPPVENESVSCTTTTHYNILGRKIAPVKDRQSLRGSRVRLIATNEMLEKNGGYCCPATVANSLVVRFLTRRFIGDYDPTLERIYAINIHLEGDLASLEILDSAEQPEDSKNSDLEAHIRWADAFVLMYSVTDKCSFDECSRLRFLISYNKRRRRNLLTAGWNTSSTENYSDVPVVLVGNKSDQIEDRMVLTEEGAQRSKELQCDAFHEVSIRENVDDAKLVIEGLHKHWKLRLHSKQRPHSVPISQHDEESRGLSFFGRKHIFALTRHVDSMEIIDEGHDMLRLPNSLSFGSPPQSSPPHHEFRSRASTDGNISWKKYSGGKNRHEKIEHSNPSTNLIPASSATPPIGVRNERRMSMSMRGKTATNL